MSSFLNPLKGLARIATMERSDEYCYERQRANANAKQWAFICVSCQFCSGFRGSYRVGSFFQSYLHLYSFGLSISLNSISILTQASGLFAATLAPRSISICQQTPERSACRCLSTDLITTPNCSHSLRSPPIWLTLECLCHVHGLLYTLPHRK